MLSLLSSTQFVADGVFKAELNEFLMRELAEDGSVDFFFVSPFVVPSHFIFFSFFSFLQSYSGVEVRVTPTRTEIIILATRTQQVLGEKGRRIRELTTLVQKRFHFAEDSIELYAEKVANRGLCAIAQVRAQKAG